MLLVTGVLLISVFGNGVYGMECYVCISDLDGACASPSSTDGVVISVENCDGGSCMQYKTDHGYARACSFLRVNEDCVSGEYQGVSAEVCACNSNLCNKSAGLCSSVITYMTMLAVSLSFKYWK